MPPVSAVPPPEPVLPEVPARLLSSASAPVLANPEADPGYKECLAALATVASVEPYNPEADPGYRECWDDYWSRVRPQRSRPYDKTYLQTPRPKTPEGG
jgi:hypothetical protein